MADAVGAKVYREWRVDGRVVELDRMLDEYYEARGWTAQGIPTAAKLDELGLPTP